MLEYKDPMTPALFARWLRDGADVDYTEVAWALRWEFNTRGTEAGA